MRRRGGLVTEVSQVRDQVIVRDDKFGHDQIVSEAVFPVWTGVVQTPTTVPPVNEQAHAEDVECSHTCLAVNVVVMRSHP